MIAHALLHRLVVERIEFQSSSGYSTPNFVIGFSSASFYVACACIYKKWWSYLLKKEHRSSGNGTGAYRIVAAHCAIANRSEGQGNNPQIAAGKRTTGLTAKEVRGCEGTGRFSI